MKVVVARYEDGEPIYNTRFLAFATHYGFRPVACRPRRPQTKGKVERPFLYIEKNLLSGREFRSLEHLNEVAAWWLKEVADVREHRQTRRRPIDMHAEEVLHLIPLAVRVLEGLLAAQRCGWDHAQKVLTLLGIYRREDLLAALERAVRYGAFSAKSIERILAVQARPKTCWDRMAEAESSRLDELLSDDPTPPRPAAEYQNLLFEESDPNEPTEEKDDRGEEVFAFLQVIVGEYLVDGDEVRLDIPLDYARKPRELDS